MHTIINNQILSGEHLKILEMRVKMLPSNKISLFQAIIKYYIVFGDLPSVSETNIASKNNCLFFIPVFFIIYDLKNDFLSSFL